MPRVRCAPSLTLHVVCRSASSSSSSFGTRSACARCDTCASLSFSASVCAAHHRRLRKRGTAARKCLTGSSASQTLLKLFLPRHARTRAARRSPWASCTLRCQTSAAATREFFGAATAEWRLDAADVPASTRTLQLLLRQPSVTAVRVEGSGVPAQLHELVGGIAMATQLTAISLQDNHCDAAEFSYSAATSWLRQLASLTSLQRLELRGRLLPEQALLVASAMLVQLRQLTALVLEGAVGQDGKADNAVATLGPVLIVLTEVSELGLRGVFMGRTGMRAVGGVLGSLSRLCSLDLSCAVSVGKHVNMTGVPLAACTALTKLDLTRCRLRAGCNSVHELCGMQARLLSLTLAGNYSLGSDAVRVILAVPSLLGLTRLSLVSVGMQLAGAWPWRQLCALTMLRDLLLTGNRLEDACASALAPCVPTLVQLRRFDISECGLTVAGALARALWRLPRLQQLACE